jgi:hypothetical protein
MLEEFPKAEAPDTKCYKDLLLVMGLSCPRNLLHSTSFNLHSKPVREELLLF